MSCLLVLGLLSLHFLSTPKSFLPVSEFVIEELEFKDFLSAYSKSYSEPEYSYRFKVFRENLSFIRSSNLEKNDWWLGVNEFADLTMSEFRFPSRFASKKNPRKLSAQSNAIVDTLSLPNSVNWIEKGAVTSVKTQGNCWSSYAFSTVGSIEGAWAIAGNALTSLSAQQIIDCSGNQGNEGCNGGLMDFSFEYIMQNGGITSDAIYPYVANDDGDCQQALANQTVAKVSNYTDIVPNSSSALLSAVVLQPVSVAVEADLAIWQFYNGGVVSRNCGTLLDTGVLVVGYKIDANPPYYIVKNSWGPRWGEAGYIRIAVVDGPGVCGIQIEPSFPIV